MNQLQDMPISEDPQAKRAQRGRAAAPKNSSQWYQGGLHDHLGQLCQVPEDEKNAHL